MIRLCRKKTRLELGGVSKAMSKIMVKMAKISKRRAEAFSLTELLIAMIIASILGGVAIGALWLFFASFSQIDDLTSAEFQLNHAVQRLSREFAMIGLGMPNNRDGAGAFAWSFRGATPQPITALFGPPAGSNPEAWAWGGPVTVAAADSGNASPIPVGLHNPHPAGPNRNLFIGPQLFYAWGVPTGVMATVNAVGMDAPPARVSSGTRLWLETRTAPPNPAGSDILRNISWDGRNIGLLPANEVGGGGNNVRSWVLLPTLHIPMLAEEFIAGASPVNSVLSVQAAPGLGGINEAPQLESRTLMLMDEIHLMQAARIYRSQHPDLHPNELRRVILTEHEPAANFPHEVLARNIVALQFVFDPEARTLTMFVAARGNERKAHGERPGAWPAWLPHINVEDTHYRIVVKTLTWRIRN